LANSNQTQLIIQAVDQASAIFQAIGLSSDGMSKDMQKALADSTKSLQMGQTALVGFKDSMTSTIGSMKGLVADFGMVGIGAGIIKQTKDWSESVYDLKRALGSSAEDASKMLVVGQATGISADEAGARFAKFGRAISTAKDEMVKADAAGKQSNDMFTRLGISYDQLNGKNVAQVFSVVADKMRNMADGAEKDAVAMALFGRAGFQVTEMMNLTKAQIDEITQRAQQQGLILNDETTEAWHHLGLEMGQVMNTMKGFAVQIGSDMLPALQRKADAIKDVADKYNQLSPTVRAVIGETAEAAAEFAALQLTLKGLSLFIGMASPAWAAMLCNPWTAAALAIGLAIDKVWEYSSAMNKQQIDRANSRSDNPTFDENGNVIPMYAGARGHRDDYAPEQYKSEDKSPGLAPPYTGGGTAAANKYENALASANALMAQLQEKIASQSGGSAFEVSMAQLAKQDADWKKQTTHLGQDGIDTTDLEKMVKQYDTEFTAKITKNYTDAWIDAKDQAALINDQILGDKNKEADDEYQITLRKIEKERLAEIKAIGKTSKDPKAIAQADADAASKTTLAGKKRDDTKDNNGAQAFQQQIAYANELVTLTGATTDQVDAIKEAANAKEKARLTNLIAAEKQGSDDWYKYNSMLAAVEVQQNDLAATHLETSFGVAYTAISHQTHNYANDVIQTFNEINGQITDNLTKMLQGTETFSQGMRNVFQSMTNDIIAMFVKMWESKYVQPWLQTIFNGLTGGSTSGTGAPTPIQSAPTPMQDAVPHAAGGVASGWSLVGEQGPELAYFGDPAQIYTAGQSQRMMSPGSGGTTSPNVNVTVINKSGQQVNVSQQAIYDPQTHTMLMNMFVDGIQNNIGGARDALFGRG